MSKPFTPAHFDALLLELIRTHVSFGEWLKGGFA